ncbi:hypothetical protein J4401_01190 [Candidatus Woesearchaeota archaeon]|nr:hypothetical protein [Candidatus Woesearchaeota archaeon]
MVKEFGHFIRRGDVKKQSVDIRLSQATFRESAERIVLAAHLLRISKPKYALENAYELMREAADALLYADGYKSYSHEASIIYLLENDFSEHDVLEFDRYRKIRNSIK